MEASMNPNYGAQVWIPSMELRLRTEPMKKLHMDRLVERLEPIIADHMLCA